MQQANRFFNQAISYVDDITLMAMLVEDLQDLVKRIGCTQTEYNMQINAAKALLMQRTMQITVLVNGKVLEQVPSFRYLRSVIH